MWLEVRKGLCERARDEETDEGRERERERVIDDRRHA